MTVWYAGALFSVADGYLSFGETAYERDPQEMSVVQNILNILFIRVTQRTENPINIFTLLPFKVVFSSHCNTEMKSHSLIFFLGSI